EARVRGCRRAAPREVGDLVRRDLVETDPAVAEALADELGEALRTLGPRRVPLGLRTDEDERVAHTRRCCVAQRVSSWRLESCSFRSTLETWLSTVFTDRLSR